MRFRICGLFFFEWDSGLWLWKKCTKRLIFFSEKLLDWREYWRCYLNCNISKTLRDAEMRFEGNFIVIFMLFWLILWLKPIEVQIEALEPYEKLEKCYFWQRCDFGHLLILNIWEARRNTEAFSILFYSIFNRSQFQ